MLNGLIRVRLIEQNKDPEETAADLHRRRVWIGRVDTLRYAVHGAPYPIWQSDPSGQISWANEAYIALCKACAPSTTNPLPRLFDLDPEGATARCRLLLQEGHEQLWYDISTVTMGDCTMHYAIDINAVVQAEIAQKNFVQTLSKTFAQMAVGLAIFDRKRELALFNPALSDLTELSPEFLSNRPGLASFFDRLHDSQMMPEPRNYHSWREQMNTLVERARDGQFLETWNLPSGLTYRVSGRPHPDGAVAFLFEDISAEVSQNRRFRADLELNRSVLNGLDQAIAVFSASGVLNFCNAAYRHQWQVDPENSLVESTLEDSLCQWRQRSGPGTNWDSVYQFVAGTSAPKDQRFSVTLSNGLQVMAQLSRLTGGASMIAFDPDPALPVTNPMAESA